MSDFIYSQKKIAKGILAKKLKRICKNNMEIYEFHGEWGSLALIENHYRGYDYYETDNHIFVIIGGPLLNYEVSDTNERNSKTKKVYESIVNKTIKWDTDLSGPFTALLINKISKEITCITDILSYIPIYASDENELSTHVDILAELSNKKSDLDIISQVDFILNGIVTYPYTSYIGIKQLAPASIHVISEDGFKINSQHYWLPHEEKLYENINDAAKDIRNILVNFIDKSIGEEKEIGHFISGGEDSRLLASLLPKNIKKNAIIFLDDMNREGKIAKTAAKVYGSKFKLYERNKLYYLDILPKSSELVGQGAAYTHGHTIKFVDESKLLEYPLVFGGLYSDSLLKALCIPKTNLSERFPFFPEKKKKNNIELTKRNKGLFKPEVMEMLVKRKQEHLKYVESIRPESADEWFYLWPISMNENTPNIHVNRRLFRSYEPFLANEIVKISAGVPQEWKMNRRLFQKMAKPLLKPTKYLFHGDGRLPYYPWYVNSVLQLIVKVNRRIGRKLKLIEGNQGPWGKQEHILNSEEWNEMVNQYSKGILPLSDALEIDNIHEIFDNNYINATQKQHLLQTIYLNSFSL